MPLAKIDRAMAQVPPQATPTDELATFFIIGHQKVVHVLDSRLMQLELPLFIPASTLDGVQLSGALIRILTILQTYHSHSSELYVTCNSRG